MNKKGQMMPQDGQTGMFSGVNPLLPIGIFVFVVPFLSSIIPFLSKLSLMKGLGIILIILGAILSIFKSE